MQPFARARLLDLGRANAVHPPCIIDSAAHLKRYLGGFDFRYDERSAFGVSDAERAAKALNGIAGKRLAYRRTNEAYCA